MKYIFNIITTIVFVAITFSSCTDDETAFVAKAPVNGEFSINPSAANIVLIKLDAETQTAISFDWDASLYGVNTPVKYTVEIDAIDGDFSDPVVRETIETEKTFTHAEMNYIALSLNLVPNAEGQIKVRLKANLNYGVMPAYSKVETISVTPYETINFMYPMPAELYLQGDAVASGWGYPIPDAQKMTQIDNHRFGLIVSLTAWKNFAFITNPNAWSDPAYVAATGNEPLVGGNFIPSGSNTVPAWGGTPMSSPASSGFYKVIIDLVEGTYSITPEPSLLSYPEELYIIGDATPLGWATGPSQKFTKINEYTFSITIPLIEGKFYDFITSLTWSDPAYKAATGSEPLMGGNFIASGSATVPAWGGNDIKAPASGTYTVTVNFKSGTYILVQ
ncbi:MAG TPA: SusE domain-containing protein [Lutibacter sp.]|nr:SusE domain-containing protein [Lutibacter sp.]